jgi:competence CoiA-like predicted nuclease
MITIEAGIMAAFVAVNSPWGKQPFQEPFLLVEKTINEDFYLSSFNSSRTYMKRPNSMEPQTALWKISGGYRFENFTIEVGHQSEHQLWVKDKFTESYDYIKVSFKEVIK